MSGNYGVISDQGAVNFHMLDDETVAVSMADFRVGSCCQLRLKRIDALHMLRAARELLTPKVGYGRPPVETRFKPGQSGNPKGRPRAKR